MRRQLPSRALLIIIGMVRRQLGVILGSKAGFLSRRVRQVKVAGCDCAMSQGAISGSCKVRHERVARCEVVVLHLAKFGSCRVRCSGVAPCDVFLTILLKSGGKGKVDANVLGVSKGGASVPRGSRRRNGRRLRMGRQRALLHVLTAWGALLPCGGRRSPQYRGLTCPVSGFHFPSMSEGKTLHEEIKTLHDRKQFGP